MTTSRFRWLLTLGVVGTLLGLVRGQELLALIGLSLLVWLFAEWLLFRLRYLMACRSLTCTRWVNGNLEQQGTLWSGRAIDIEVRVASSAWFSLPVVRAADYLADWWEVGEGANQADGIVARSTLLEIAYTARPRAAGRIELPGVSVRLLDLHGLFFAQTFIACRQQFRVLPMPITTDSPRSHRKLNSALPPPGIHRLQKAGMGGELLDLREYQPGDPPKSIAWKVSARRDCLMIRQHESEVPIRTTLMVDHSESTRCGSFGLRPLDQLMLLSGTIARSSLTVRDPVGLKLIDEQQVHTVLPSGGNRQYFQILNDLSQAASRPVTLPGRLNEELVQQAWQVAHDRHPLLMQSRVNRPPFFWFPISPAARYQARKRAQLAALFTELYGLPLDAPLRLLFDDENFTRYLQRFLAESGCCLLPRVISHPRNHRLKVDQFTEALLSSIARGRDNELFVLLADLLDHSNELGRLPHAIRVATARHHRVIVICPWPDWLGPRRLHGEAPIRQPHDMEQLLYEGERLRLSQSAQTLARTLRRSGASVAYASDPKVTQLVLTQADLVRSGRISAR